jgi:hypothetical protein
MARQITCITKFPTHEDRHRRIQAVGGSVGIARWNDAEDIAIANVKRDPHAYFVTEVGRSVWVVVRTHNGRD